MIPQHIAKLREHVGHDVLVLPCAAILPVQAGQVLLALARERNVWELIGGFIDPDESPQDAAMREATEELGVGVVLGDLLGVFGGPNLRVVYPNGDQISAVVVVFEADVFGEFAPDGEEIDGVGWHSITGLDSVNLYPVDRFIIKQLVKHRML